MLFKDSERHEGSLGKSHLQTRVSTTNYFFYPFLLIYLFQDLASRMIEAKRISSKPNKTDEKMKTEDEIRNLDEEIDKQIYKFYDITEEEKLIIEESLK